MLVTWCVVIGLLLVIIGVTDTLRQPLPFSTSALYLGVGYLLGPDAFRLLDLKLLRDAALIEHLTEGAVLISLFAVGLRLRAPIRDPIWRAPLAMATIGMLLTIAMMVGVGVLLGLPLGAAMLMAAVLAPTDPVLASDVQVSHALDSDRLRFSLTGEGGLNDGAAFPFVMLGLGLLGLHELGAHGMRWLGVDVVWATAGGIAIGWFMGFLFGRAVVYLRKERGQALGMESFLTLGLIALTYGIALACSTYGFLAVFAAGLAMRQVERRDSPMPDAPDPADAPEMVDDTPLESPSGESSMMTKAVLNFTLDLEKLAELTVMVLIGSLLTREAFTPVTVGVAATLIFVVRPVAIVLSTWHQPLTAPQRRLAAWFGIRGIGSIYYLAYAVAHGAASAELLEVADAVLVTVALSVPLHGSSATPVMSLYRRARGISN